jgi:hypothetical protein
MGSGHYLKSDAGSQLRLACSRAHHARAIPATTLPDPVWEDVPERRVIRRSDCNVSAWPSMRRAMRWHAHHKRETAATIAPPRKNGVWAWILIAWHGPLPASPRLRDPLNEGTRTSLPLSPSLLGRVSAPHGIKASLCVCLLLVSARVHKGLCRTCLRPPLHSPPDCPQVSRSQDPPPLQAAGGPGVDRRPRRHAAPGHRRRAVQT